MAEVSDERDNIVDREIKDEVAAQLRFLTRFALDYGTTSEEGTGRGTGYTGRGREEEEKEEGTGPEKHGSQM